MNALYLGALSLILFLSSLSGGAWESYPFREAVSLARSQKKDVLVLYTSARMGDAGVRWVKEVESSRPSTVAKSLDDDFILCRVDLPLSVRMTDVLAMKSVELASKHGVTVVPTMALCDERGRVYARLLGGIRQKTDAPALANRLKKARKLKLARDVAMEGLDPKSKKYVRDAYSREANILTALKNVPLAAWQADYPELMRELDQLECNASAYQQAKKCAIRQDIDARLRHMMLTMPMRPSSTDIERFLKKIEGCLMDKNLTVEQRQFILLNYQYPLFVKKAQLAYDGTVTMASEEAFDQSIETLEDARDLDKNSYWGREAHRIREELRKARLAAAKYD